VIDASVIPEAPRANLHLTVVMIAEHMAESIRNGGEPETAPPPEPPHRAPPLDPIGTAVTVSRC
jgi:choline dehydrogenase-like flavoprotein